MSLPDRLVSIWTSLRALPLWVQLWMIFILVPVNVAGVAFLDTHHGWVAAILGIGGMLPNLLIIWRQRGFSKAMAFPHLPTWTVLVIWLSWTLANDPSGGTLQTYLTILLIVDVISLAFDYPDALKYLRGDRAIAWPDEHQDNKDGQS